MAVGLLLLLLWWVPSLMLGPGTPKALLAMLLSPAAWQLAQADAAVGGLDLKCTASKSAQFEEQVLGWEIDILPDKFCS